MHLTLRKALIYWVPIPVYVALIFLASSFSQMPFRLPVAWLDKVIHFAEYALLAILVARGVRFMAWPKSGWAVWLATVGVVLVCAALDELYQGTIANRHSDILDFVADGLGGATGSLTYLLVAARWQARKGSLAR